MTVETFDQRDEATWRWQWQIQRQRQWQRQINWEHLQRAILVTCDIWDTDYISDNWEPEFMTIFVTWQSRVTLDSIRNSCDVFVHIRRKPTKTYCSDKRPRGQAVSPFPAKTYISDKRWQFVFVVSQAKALSKNWKLFNFAQNQSCKKLSTIYSNMALEESDTIGIHHNL